MLRTFIFLIIAAAVITGAYFYHPFTGTKTTESVAAPVEPVTAPVQATSTNTNLQNKNMLEITDLQVGTGAEARSGMTVTVNYIGTLENGTKFDSSYDHGQTFSFALGAGQVIKGWDEGLVGMKVGGKRRLKIPPDLAYGNRAVGGVIPANSTLVFEVELLAVK